MEFSIGGSGCILWTLKLKSLELIKCSTDVRARGTLLQLTSLERLSVNNCNWFDEFELKKVTQFMVRLRHLDISHNSHLVNLSCLDNLKELEGLVTDTSIEGYDALKFGRLRIWELAHVNEKVCRDLSKLFKYVNVFC